MSSIAHDTPFTCASDVELLQSLPDIPDQFSYLWRHSERTVAFFGSVADVTGFEAHELDGHASRWQHIVHPDDRTSFLRMLDGVSPKDGQTHAVTLRFIHKDGSILICDHRSRVVEGKTNGDQPFTLGHVSDLTQRQSEKVWSEAQARELDALYRNAPIGLAALDSELRFLRINEELAEMNGLPVEDHIGRQVWDVVPTLREAAEPLLQRVLATGEEITGIEFSGETPKAPGEIRHWIEQFYPLNDGSGQPIGVGVICQEVTPQKRAEAARDVMTRELHHRIKNIYAVISGLVSATARGCDDVSEMAEKLRGRIFALSRAQDAADIDEVRADALSGPVTIASLLRRILEPYHHSARGQVSMTGPTVRIPPGMASAFALCLHELCTNSMKFGALGEPGGVINVTWNDQGGALTFNWNEAGPFSLQPPDRTGFGIQIMRQSVKQQLGGKIDFVWHPSGLDVSIEVPLPAMGASPASSFRSTVPPAANGNKAP